MLILSIWWNVTLTTPSLNLEYLFYNVRFR